MSEYQFAELVSHIRLTASKIEMKKTENIVQKNEMTYSYLYDHSNFSSREQ